MTITFKRNNKTKKASDIKQGECFKIDNYSVYIACGVSNTEINAVACVNLLTGVPYTIANDKEVEPCECEVVVK